MGFAQARHGDERLAGERLRAELKLDTRLQSALHAAESAACGTRHIRTHVRRGLRLAADSHADFFTAPGAKVAQGGQGQTPRVVAVKQGRVVSRDKTRASFHQTSKLECADWVDSPFELCFNNRRSYKAGYYN